ncbi:MAG: hypothetical protein WCK17_13880, partial [Verrucomicrobiota bacterium]
MKHKRSYPDATPYTDRHGKRRWRFRKGAGFSRELGTEYASEDFTRRYEAALQEHLTGKKAGAGAAKSVPGSVNDLVAAWYLSPEWKALADLTKKTYRGVIEPFRIKHGDKPVNRLERRHVMCFLAEKSETPSAANN